MTGCYQPGSAAVLDADLSPSGRGSPHTANVKNDAKKTYTFVEKPRL
jgi:hypothetical protein